MSKAKKDGHFFRKALREADSRGGVRRLLMEIALRAPSNAASLYTFTHAGRGAGLFARPTNDFERAVYGTPMIYRFDELPCGTDGNVFKRIKLER